MPSIKLPDHIDVFFTKINETRQIPLTHAETVAFHLAYGFKQKGADVHAPVKRENYKTESEWKDAVRVVVDAYVADCIAGRVPSRGGGQAAKLAAANAAVVAQAARIAELEAQLAKKAA